MNRITVPDDHKARLLVAGVCLSCGHSKVQPASLMETSY